MKTIPNKRQDQAYWLMSKPVETVWLKDSMRDVATLFSDKNISAAAVIDDNKKPIGVITKTDLARYEQKIDEEDMVEHWMTPVIFSVKPDTPVVEIARRMVKYGVHHIFVRGMDGEPLVGVVSSFDLIKKIANGKGNGHV